MSLSQGWDGVDEREGGKGGKGALEVGREEEEPTE